MRPKKLKVFLLSVIVAVLGAVAVIFIGYRHIEKQPESLLDAIGQKVDVSLGSIHHTATREGRKEWTLEAESARLIGSENQLILTDLSIVYFMEDGKEIYLTAKNGIFNTKSNDIVATGNVVLISEPYELKTDELSYKHKKRTVHSGKPIRVISTQSYLGADAMSFDLKTHTASFKGNVEGIFTEKIVL